MYLKYKHKLIIGITLLIIICIIISTYAYLEYIDDSNGDTTDGTDMSFELDDQISPGINQGVIIEINRIRHRGLLDKIMQTGRSWKSKPNFYFITEMDGLEYISKDVGSASRGTHETFFNTWDTMFQDNKIVRDAEEEQEFSEITLKIMEHTTSGLLGRQSNNVEKEMFQMTYDYKTGEWYGDDSRNDTDGYGHYVGENYEIWFRIYQMDYDGDTIPYWTEVNVLHTDPTVDDTNLDPDADGVPTVWEWKWGYDPNTFDNHTSLDPDQDGLQNIEEYQMAKWFADPFSQDIYLEVDGMKSVGLFDPEHILWDESQQIIIERFAQHRINVYIDHGWPDAPINGGGQLVDHYERMSQDSGMMVQFYNNYFPEERQGIFRYVVMCHRGGFCHPSHFNRYDTIAVGISNQQMIQAKGAFTPRTYRLMAASSVMHELGHSLGIGPWTVEGCDNFTFAEGRAQKEDFLTDWGNYRSVMSYYYIYDKTVIDYSDGSHGSGDSDDWSFLNLTYFESDSKVIEDPSFELPGIEEIGLIKTMSLRSQMRNIFPLR